MNINKLVSLSAILLATTALSGIARAEPADSVYDWSGFYVGAHVGYGESAASGLFEGRPEDDFENFGGSFDLDPDGVVGGLKAGYNWQFDNIVFGVEADITFTDWSERLTSSQGDSVEVNTDLIGTLRGRLGYATDGLLIFVTGGVALSDAEYQAHSNSFDGTDKFNGLGFVVGGGAEFALSENIGLTAEALYLGFEDEKDTNSTVGNEVGDFSKYEDAWMARFGVNFHF